MRCSLADRSGNGFQHALNGFGVFDRNFGGLFSLFKLFPGALKFQFCHTHLRTGCSGLGFGFGGFRGEFPKPASFRDAFGVFLHSFKDC